MMGIRNKHSKFRGQVLRSAAWRLAASRAPIVRPCARSSGPRAERDQDFHEAMEARGSMSSRNLLLAMTMAPAFLAIGAQAALAQNASDTQTPSAAAASAPAAAPVVQDTLQEIVVTAEKRVESVQSVPISITVL